MGAGASATAIQQIDAATLAEAVRKIGPAYAEYAETIESNGIDGLMLTEYRAGGGVDSLLDDMEVTKPLHRKKLASMLAPLLSAAAPAAASAPPSDAAPAASPAEPNTAPVHQSAGGAGRPANRLGFHQSARSRNMC